MSFGDIDNLIVEIILILLVKHTYKTMIINFITCTNINGFAFFFLQNVGLEDVHVYLVKVLYYIYYQVLISIVFEIIIIILVYEKLNKHFISSTQIIIEHIFVDIIAYFAKRLIR